MVVYNTRETALLVDPESSSAAQLQWVCQVVGHELAHQWYVAAIYRSYCDRFGNLVTMEWWTYLWLNEGFASYVEYLCADYCFPGNNTFFIEVIQSRMECLDTVYSRRIGQSIRT